MEAAVLKTTARPMDNQRRESSRRVDAGQLVPEANVIKLIDPQSKTPSRVTETAKVFSCWRQSFFTDHAANSPDVQSLPSRPSRPMLPQHPPSCR